MVKEKFPRYCDECGKGMWDGYCLYAGEQYYCSKKCLNKHFTDEEFMEQYDNGNGESYWTEWYEDDIDEKEDEMLHVNDKSQKTIDQFYLSTKNLKEFKESVKAVIPLLNENGKLKIINLMMELESINKLGTEAWELGVCDEN